MGGEGKILSLDWNMDETETRSVVGGMNSWSSASSTDRGESLVILLSHDDKNPLGMDRVESGNWAILASSAPWLSNRL